jgi:hypothetical protein
MSEEAETLTGFEVVPEALRCGRRCRRRVWHADAFIYRVAGSTLKVDQEPLVSMFRLGDTLSYGQCIDLYTGTGLIIAWQPDHESILARDWEVLS